MGFGLYNLVSLLNVALTGWPSFGLLHRLCRRTLPSAAQVPGRPGARAVVLAAQRARRSYERNVSEGVVSGGMLGVSNGM